MRVRKQDSVTGDMQFGHGSADFWHNVPEAVGQSVMTRLLLFAGEWFLDISEGTPWAASRSTQPSSPKAGSWPSIRGCHATRRCASG